MNKERLNHNYRTVPPKEEPKGAFRLRAYGRTELAQAYNPHLSPGAAWQKLSLWIHLYPDLAERLKALAPPTCLHSTASSDDCRGIGRTMRTFGNEILEYLKIVQPLRLKNRCT